MSSSQKVRVTFEFTTTTQPGEDVLIVGEAEELGSWNPEKGVLMKTDPERYPVWSTPVPALIQSNSSTFYKYVYFNKASYKWEELKENRKLEVEDFNMIVKDKAGSHISRQIQSQIDPSVSFARTLENPIILVDEGQKFSPENSIIIVSMNLPIRVERNPNYDSQNPNSEKWVFENAKGLWLPVLYEIANQENINFVWIGWPHICVEDEAEQEELANELRAKYKCEPLFIPEDTMALHTQFCNGILYPLFNNIIDTSEDNNPQYSEELWEAYRKVNSIAADKIMKIYKDELIWVHDYQLLLTPSFVSRRTRDILNIGIFLHNPFPSSEVFRVLPHREAILHAMLCCDLIGFHLFEYARHFLGSCKSLLGIDHQFSPKGYLMLDYYGRHIMIRIGHLGVEPKIIDNVLASEGYSNIMRDLKTKYAGKKVLVGVDPLHRLSGIALKLNAFKLSMKNLMHYKNKIVFVQLLIEAKNSSDAERDDVLQEIVKLKTEINAEIGTNVVEFVDGSIITRELRYAYMSIAYGIVNSSYKEGLFLIPFEVIAISKEKPVEIIISEFTGVSRALSSLKRVNPFDIAQLEAEIHYLITTPTSSDNAAKRKRDLNYINTNTTLKWAFNFLSDLIRAKKDTKHFQYVTHGLGDKLKLIALKKKFSLLKADYLLKAYKETKNRAFFFDNEGTLSNLLKQTEIDKSVGPSEKIVNCLTDLCKDERNSVFVVTGRMRAVVENWFGSIQGLGMAAEYGAILKWNYGSTWENSLTGEMPWIETAKQIIGAYVVRTEGSTMEAKECSVVFSYRDTDPDIGSWQAKELISHLEILLKPFMNECEVSAGLGYVEVKPQGTTKGTAVYKVLQDLKERRGPPDFILTIGDDIADEEMFKVVKALKKEGSNLLAHKRELKSFTCTVGRKPSSADFYVNDANEVVHILEQLRGWSNVCKKNYSYGDLRALSTRHSYRLSGQFDTKSPLLKPMESYAEESDEEEPLSPIKVWRE
ncbi:unnamed protein product [Blepharisma stoltei]|uniref:CBM20 domain-containing protein n=1 Tax=Blepharisma stoltei TaxID=1481888 RepID=A0AAU9K823_9CILI|nr:unnamed protein product [Blepharisma stoltei]